MLKITEFDFDISLAINGDTCVGLRLKCFIKYNMVVVVWVLRVTKFISDNNSPVTGKMCYLDGAGAQNVHKILYGCRFTGYLVHHSILVSLSSSIENGGI